MEREELLVRTFVNLTDTLVEQFDIIELLTTLADGCVSLDLADAAGILLADSESNLRLMAASSEKVRLLELFQLQNEQGPCLEAYASGTAVIDSDLTLASKRWPKFAPEAVGVGFRSVYAFPLRIRAEVIGALNLFDAEAAAMTEANISLARALADVASIAILQDQALRQSEVRAGQLQNALDSRVAIEQAKGMLSERFHIDMVQAFELIRTYARSSQLHLTSVAQELVAGSLLPESITAGSANLLPDSADPRGIGAESG